MAAIDLSKAKIGDKFRTRVGEIVEFVGKSVCSDSYIVRRKSDNYYYHVYVFGALFEHEEDDFDLVEQVLDEPEPKVTFEETEPKPSFELPKMDEFNKMGKELMQTLKSQLGGINNEQRFARRERIALTLIHIMGADRLYDLVENTTAQDNLKDLVDIVESIIGG